MLTRIENLLPRSFGAQEDETIEAILARCYQIARARARQAKLVETHARDERETTGDKDDEKKNRPR